MVTAWRTRLLALATASAAALLVAPPSPAAQYLPTDDPIGALAAAKEQANRTGVTYRMSGRITQRNAAGTVFVDLSEGKPVGIVLRDSAGIYRDYGAASDPFVGLGAKVAKAYRLSDRPLLEVGPVDPQYLKAWTDPWGWVTTAPFADYFTDAQGRLVRVDVQGEEELQILEFAAPKAVAPAPDRLYTMDSFMTVSFVSMEGDNLQEEARSALQSASVDGKFKSDPRGTLYRKLDERGWTYKRTSQGARLTVRGGTGATWTAAIDVVPWQNSNIKTTYATLPPITAHEVIGANYGAGTALEGIGQSASLLRQLGRPMATPSTVDKWMGSIFKEQPQSPGRLRLSDGTIVTYAGTGSPWRLRIAVESEGSCADTLMDPKRPQVVEAVGAPGAAGPGGSCVPSGSPAASGSVGAPAGAPAGASAGDAGDDEEE